MSPSSNGAGPAGVVLFRPDVDAESMAEGVEFDLKRRVEAWREGNEWSTVRPQLCVESRQHSSGSPYSRAVRFTLGVHTALERFGLTLQSVQHSSGSVYSCSSCSTRAVRFIFAVHAALKRINLALQSTLPAWVVTHVNFFWLCR